MKTPDYTIVSTLPNSPKAVPGNIASVVPSAIGLATSAVMVLLLLGCASPRPPGVTQVGVPVVPDPVLLEGETIAVGSPSAPARFSFDRAKGRTEYAGEGAGGAARKFLEPSRQSDPLVGAVLGSAGLVVAPFAAAYGGISSGRKKLGPDQLSQSETDLARAMALMAEQNQLCGPFLKAARDKTHRRLVPVESLAGLESRNECVDAALETRIEELRLERTGSGDASFALRIRARLRLVRAADGAILLDEPFQYRSGKALFHDWTLHRGLQSVAESAYRELAGRMVERLSTALLDEPVLVGAGYRKSPVRTPEPAVLLAAHRLQPGARVQFVNHALDDEGIMGIFTAPTLSRVTYQRPLTKSDAITEAVRESDWSLDGLQDSHSPIISVSACAAAIPMSLWKQTVGAIRGVTRKQLQTAEGQLNAAAQSARPSDDLSRQVALALAPRGSELAMVASTAGLQRTGGTLGERLFGAGTRLVRQGRNASAADLALESPLGTALDIQVIRAGLKGPEGVNPPLALCVEARATLVRATNGRALCSFPIRYRSAERKFLEWAAHDARLFRQELGQSSHDMGRAIVGQLKARGLIVPGRARFPTLADNSQ